MKGDPPDKPCCTPEGRRGAHGNIPPDEASPTPSPPPLDPRLLDIVQAAPFLSVSPSSVSYLNPGPISAGRSAKDCEKSRGSFGSNFGTVLTSNRQNSRQFSVTG